MRPFYFAFFTLAILFFGSLFATQRSQAKIKTIEIRGYVTQVNSPSSFELDEYKVTLDGKYDVELQNIEDKALKFDPSVHIKVGTLVKMKCKVDTDTLEARVEEIKIDVKQFRRLSHTTILDSRPAEMRKSESGKWTGTIIADARRILIAETTDVRFKLNTAEQREAKEKKREKDDEKDKEATAPDPNGKTKVLNESDDRDFEEEQDIEDLRLQSKPLESLENVGPGVYMTYKGVENLDGTLEASSVVFVKNEKTDQERKLWEKLRIKEKESKKTNSFDVLKIAGEKYKALPEDEIQEYVNSLGWSLVPDYQKNLPDEDDNKIPFRFVVIHEDAINAGAYATGTVVINHDVFNYIENEAQLAFLLSHEIAHATQEHTLRALNDRKKTRGWLRVGAIASYAMGYGLLARTFAMTEQAMRVGYQRSIENQADRVGLANLVSHGFDPREAPRLWKISAINFGDRKTDFFWSSHSSASERRSYLMLTLKNTYAGLDYADLKRDSDEFRKIAAVIREKYPNKKKKKL